MELKYDSCPPKSNHSLLAAITFSCALLLAGCGGVTDSATSNLKQYVEQGQTYLANNQFKAAYQAASNAIAAAPEKIDGYLLLAKIYNRSGQPQQSVKLLETYQLQKNVEYYFLLLDAYQKSSKLISASGLIAEHSQLLAQQPERLKRIQATIWLDQKQLKKAKTAFSELAQTRHHKLDGLIGLARIEAVSNNLDAALLTLDKVISLDKNNSESLILKSYIYLNRGELSEAEQALSQSLAILPPSDVFSPQKINTLQLLTEVLTAQGRSAEAMIYSRILSDEFPGAELVKTLYAEAVEHYKTQQLAQAKKILTQILDTAPGHKKASTLLGVILYSQGKIEEADKYLSAAVDPETTPSKLTQLYAMTQLRLNQGAEVLAMLAPLVDQEKNPGTLALYAIAAISQQQFSKAKSALDKALQLSPDSARLALILNHYYTSLEQPEPEKALQALTPALEKHPADSQLQTAHIRQLLVLKRTREAERYVRQLAEKFDDQTGTLLVIANFKIHRQNLDSALSLFNKILARQADNIQALYGLARISQIKKDWQGALSAYRDIIRYYPQQAIAYHGVITSLVQLKQDPDTAKAQLPVNHEPSILALMLANFNAQQNKLAAAQKYLQQAQPNLPDKLRRQSDRLTLQIDYKRAAAAMAYGDFDQARKILLPTLKQSPEQPNLLALLATLEIRAGQYLEARKVIGQIADILPDISLAKVLAADLALAQNQPQQALESLFAAWQQHKEEQVASKLFQVLTTVDPTRADAFVSDWHQALPNSLRASLNRAITLQGQGKPKQALALYEAVLKRAPDQITGLNNAAWIYFELGDSRAIGLAEKAFKLAPKNGPVVDTYGWILFNSGQQQQGKKLIEQAITLSPDDQGIRDHLKQVSEL